MVQQQTASSHIRLRLEGWLGTADELPTDLGVGDEGRAWFIGYTWWVWLGDRWLTALASTTGGENTGGSQ